MENKVLNSCITVSGIAILSVSLYLLFNKAVIWMSSYIQLTFFTFFVEVVVAMFISSLLVPLAEIAIVVLFINLAVSLHTDVQVNVKDLIKVFVSVQAAEIIYKALEETLNLEYGVLKHLNKYFCRNFCLFCTCKSYVMASTISTETLVNSVGDYYNDLNGIRGKINSITFISTVMSVIISMCCIYLIMRRRFWHILYLPPFIMLIPFIFLIINSLFFIMNFNSLCKYDGSSDGASIRETFPMVNIFDAVDKGKPVNLKKQQAASEVKDEQESDQMASEEFID